MTREEAINALDIVEHMESFSVLYAPGEPMAQTTVSELKKACRMAVSALRAQKTKLDRNRWEGCEWCRQKYCDNCFWGIKMKDSARCARCNEKSEWTPLVSYCSNCGRPITDEAWEKMDRRINDGTTDDA